MGDVLVVLYICTVAFVIGAYIVYRAEDMAARRFGAVILCGAIMGIFFSYYHLSMEDRNMGDIYNNTYSAGEVYYPPSH